jgi:hypothetical protein
MSIDRLITEDFMVCLPTLTIIWGRCDAIMTNHRTGTSPGWRGDTRQVAGVHPMKPSLGRFIIQSITPERRVDT